MILEMEPQYLFGGISITDWIQSLGALIGILAAIGAFISLFFKDKDKQKQIDSLALLAKTSQASYELKKIEREELENYRKQRDNLI